MNDPSLRRWLLEYNRLWFGGVLPEDKITVIYEAMGGTLGETHALADGEFIIRIDPSIKWSRRLARFTLLHELIHVKLYPNLNHGKKFQQAMLDLASRGAFKALW